MPVQSFRFRAIKRFAIGTTIVFLGLSVSYALVSNKPVVDKKPQEQSSSLSVETQAINPQPYTVTIESFGRIQPATQSTLVSQVGGQIIFIDQNFADGASFKKGDVLLRIDDSIYQQELILTEAEVTQARLRLAEENALAEQAKKDWQRIGNKKAANDLTLRIPYVEAAQAALSAAKAKRTLARLNITRTRIMAPFNGRLRSPLVGLGQVVQPGLTLAQIYALDAFEIKLPIKDKDLAFINLHSDYRDADVVLRSTADSKQRWQARLIRTESQVDFASGQLFAIARIVAPATNNHPTRTLPTVGQFVTATIRGEVIENAMLIPAQSIYQNTFVYLAEAGLLKIGNINIVYKNQEVAVVENLAPGAQLITTPLGKMISGTPITIDTAENKENPVP